MFFTYSGKQYPYDEQALTKIESPDAPALQTISNAVGCHHSEPNLWLCLPAADPSAYYSSNYEFTLRDFGR
jgi:hypothetical protein